MIDFLRVKPLKFVGFFTLFWARLFGAFSVSGSLSVGCSVVPLQLSLIDETF